MVQIKDTLVSDELFTRKFVCDLAKCKGICCVEGDSGAPVDENEKAEMERALPSVMPYMSEKGRRAVASQGAWIHDHTTVLRSRLLWRGRNAHTWSQMPTEFPYARSNKPSATGRHASKNRYRAIFTPSACRI